MVTVGQPTEIDDFSAAILQALSSDASAAGMSVPRLGKALNRSASVLMRQLTLMGDVCGVGWVHVQPADDRFMVTLTDAGSDVFKTHAQPGPR